MPPSDGTQRYYDSHANEFLERTKDLDMEELYRPFLTRLKPHARILDAGCGPGRDLRAFAERGYIVTGMDASREMVRIARDYSNQEAHHLTFQEVAWTDEFDGIWACASLLHVPLSQLPVAIKRLGRALRAGGVLYLSFKHGQGEREHNGRRFTDLDEDGLETLLQQVHGLELIEHWRTKDVRTGRDKQQWLNAILRRH